MLVLYPVLHRLLNFLLESDENFDIEKFMTKFWDLVGQHAAHLIIVVNSGNSSILFAFKNRLFYTQKMHELFVCGK